MGQVTGTNGYPTVPNWSPRYSYGTLYGTGLYSSGSYSTIPITSYSSQVVSAPVYSPPVYSTPVYAPPTYISPPVNQMYIPPIAPISYFPPAQVIRPSYQSYASVAPMVASVPQMVATIPRISAYTPGIAAPMSSPIVSPTSIMGGAFSSGGFNLFGDTDPITPGVQSTPGIIQAVGPTRVF